MEGRRGAARTMLSSSLTMRLRLPSESELPAADCATLGAAKLPGKPCEALAARFICRSKSASRSQLVSDVAVTAAGVVAGGRKGRRRERKNGMR